MEDSDKVKIASDFLVAEFNNLQERARNLEQSNSNRVNFFLAFLAAAGVGFAAAAEAGIFKSYHVLAGTLVLSALLLAGFLTLRQMILVTGVTFKLYRYAGRVRRWFVDFAPDIDRYVAFQAVDDRPKFRSQYTVFQGAEWILLIVNAALASALVGVLLFGIFAGLWAAAFFGITAGVGMWFLQQWYVRTEIERLGKSSWAQDDIHFPTTESTDLPVADKDDQVAE